MLPMPVPTSSKCANQTACKYIAVSRRPLTASLVLVKTVADEVGQSWTANWNGT